MVAQEIEKSGIPVVNITAVPSVADMVGVTRILRGFTIPSVLGDLKLSKEQEKESRKRHIRRALSILQMEINDEHVFTLEGSS